MQKMAACTRDIHTTEQQVGITAIEFLCSNSCTTHQQERRVRVPHVSDPLLMQVDQCESQCGSRTVEVLRILPSLVPQLAQEDEP